MAMLDVRDATEDVTRELEELLLLWSLPLGSAVITGMMFLLRYLFS
jgi:hypothetical protein